MRLIKEVHAGHEIAYTPPLNFRESDRYLFYEENFSFSIPSVKVFELVDVCFSTAIIVEGLRVEDMFLRHQPAEALKNISRYLRLWVKSKRLEHAIIFGSQEWGNNYFHWMSELLPAILAMHKLESKLPVMIPVTILQMKFVRESLDILHIPAVQFSKVEQLKANRMLAVPVPHVGRFNHGFLQDLSEQLLKQIGNEPDMIPHRKIYISRLKAKRRKVINEVELIDLLEEQGFEKLLLEEYPLVEQIRIFRQARIVLSNHGAGLTNIMFMHAGTHVIELKASNNNYWCYFSLARVFDLQYAYLLCKGNIEDHRNADIEVDLQACKQLLTSLDSNII